MLLKIILKNLCFVFLFLTCTKQELSIFKDTKPKSILKSDSTRLIKEVYVSDTTNIEYESKRILSITGDFNGDGRTENLTERYFNPNTGKNICQVPSGAEMDWLALNDVQSTLVCDNDSISDLLISEDWTWGLLSLLNLGDTNGDGLDEVAVVKDNADYSNISSCWIYQFCNGVWKIIFVITIHEQAFWYPDDFDTTIFDRAIPGFLEKKNDRWYYYDNDDFWGDGIYLDSTGYPVLHPLRIRKKCDY